VAAQSPTALTAFAPGKVILLGEHAVVYGEPALAGPLSLGVSARATPASRCRLEIPRHVRGAARKVLTDAFERAAAACGRPKVSVSVRSDLPISMGLGSSAALAVACTRILLRAAVRREDDKNVIRIAELMERQFHGQPSGLDHTCSALEKLIVFRRDAAGAEPSVRKIRSGRPLRLLVALAGARGPTWRAVGGLKERAQRWPKHYRGLVREIGQLAMAGAREVEQGDFTALGDAMNVNQGLLSALGVSSGAIDELVHRLRALGALGAKLTGAGGEGGAVIGLFLEPQRALVRLTEQGVHCFVSQVAGPKAL
jgi:mevalonate kinase